MDGDEVPIDNTPWPAYTYAYTPTPTTGKILVKAMDGAYGGCDWCGPECDCVCHDGKCGDCQC